MNPGLCEELFYLYTLSDPYLRPHTLSVVERVKELSGRLSASERRSLLGLAWLHDVGKSERLENTGFHPLDGATLALLHGDLYMAALISHHSGARFEALRRGLEIPLPLPSGPVLDLLDSVDATTLPSGEVCSLIERGRDIGLRYGRQSPQALAFYDFLPELELKAHSLGIS